MQTELRAQTNSTVWLFIDWRFHALAFAKNMKIKLCWVLKKQIILGSLRHNCRQRFSANPHEYHSLRKLSLATQHRHQRYWITRFFSDSICNYEMARLETVTTASTFFSCFGRRWWQSWLNQPLGGWFIELHFLSHRCSCSDVERVWKSVVEFQPLYLGWGWVFSRALAPVTKRWHVSRFGAAIWGHKAIGRKVIGTQSYRDWEPSEKMMT